jgi:hypothetical protein
MHLPFLPESTGKWKELVSGNKRQMEIKNGSGAQIHDREHLPR